MTDIITDKTDPRVLPPEAFASYTADYSEMSTEQLNALLLDSDRSGEPLRLTNIRFSHLNLRQMDLRRVTFFNCTFFKCQLALTRFEHCSIYYTKFDHCDMLLADFSHALLQHAMIERCDMNNVRFIDASFVDTYLYRVMSEYPCFDNARFEKSRLVECNFKQASAHKASFRATEFAGAEFGRLAVFDCADLKDCIFKQCNFILSQIDSTHVTRCTFDTCVFSGPRNFGNCALNEVKFMSCKSARFGFSDSFLFQCAFDDSTWDDICAQRNRILGCSFTHSRIYGNFLSTRMLGGYIDSSRIETTDNKPADQPSGYQALLLEAKYDLAPVKKFVLVGPRVDLRAMIIGKINGRRLDVRAVFDEALASDCKIINADMRHGSWRKADLSRSTFSQVNVSGCDFSGANFTDVSFTRLQDDLALYHTGRFVGTREHRDTQILPVIYNSETKWPDGFQVTEFMVHEEEAEQAKAKVEQLLGAQTLDGSVFLPSPFELSAYTYLYAILPDLFEISGRFALATNSARVAAEAMIRFSESLRKGESGENIDRFQEKLDITLSVMSETLTPSIVRATVDSSTSEHQAEIALTKLMTDQLKDRRKAHRKAAKKEAPASDPRAVKSLTSK